MLIAYIHGFLSGSQAVKSKILKKELALSYPHISFTAPDFPDTPEEAYAALCSFVEQTLSTRKPDLPLCLVGSSMGGFFSTLLSIKYHLPAVLLNPCIHPQDYFESLIGEQVNPYTDNHFVLKKEMLYFLKDCDDKARAFDPQLIKVFLQEADEVLDYKKSLNFFKNTSPVVTPGGCHAFEGFTNIIPDIVDFFEKQR